MVAMHEMNARQHTPARYAESTSRVKMANSGQTIMQNSQWTQAFSPVRGGVRDLLRVLGERGLRLPLFYKILIANTLLVAAGAVIGTTLSFRAGHQLSGEAYQRWHYVYILLFAAGGTALSALIYSFLLRWALRPLEQLQEMAEAIRQGRLDVRVPLHPFRDAQMERLVETFNRMVETIASNTESLQQALKLREQMIQNVSHELRTPLAILQGYIELMREEALGPLTSEQREALEVMQERLNGLIRYVDLLLTLQEIQAGARSLNILDLRELVREACRAYQSRLDPQRHALRVHLPDHPVWVMGEGERLLLTLTELLENAVKFSPAGGTIQVSLAVQGPEALLEVRDEGIGIPAEAISRVFEPFYQVNGGTTRKFGGMGIGLTVVKQVVEAHQGRVEIESAVGQGTRVLLRLPIVIP
jgi:signal transduction histidine kinase